MVQIHIKKNIAAANSCAILFTDKAKPDYKKFDVPPVEKTVIDRQKDAKRPVCLAYRKDALIFCQFIEPKGKEEHYKTLEAARVAGHSLYNELRYNRLTDIYLQTDSEDASLLLAYAEGLALSCYQFSKYKKDKKELRVANIYLVHKDVKDEDAKELQSIIEANFLTRDLVNEPVSFLTAEEFSEQMKKAGKKAGFKVEVFNKSKIEALKMGGLLSVNAGSIDPPTFNVLEWKPKNAKNKKPIILVGKGVVFDTGGLSLKPTTNSMDLMKSDMGGGAAVVGTMYAVAKNEIPLHIIGLIPATDNRPGGRATAPGDIIIMLDGTTVEVMNTDAEGRLILGDALAYAKKYKPELVIDLATLTGAAARAIGPYGTVYMGNAGDDVKEELEKSGRKTYERLVEFPMWDEYAELIKSEIADLKNVGGPNAGMVTAGKFLEHFTDYPWLHFDIAGPAFLTSGDLYRGKNATGVGVRLLYQFLKKRGS